MAPSIAGRWVCTFPMRGSVAIIIDMIQQLPVAFTHRIALQPVTQPMNSYDQLCPRLRHDVSLKRIDSTSFPIGHDRVRRPRKGSHSKVSSHRPPFRLLLLPCYAICHPQVSGVVEVPLLRIEAAVHPLPLLPVVIRSEDCAWIDCAGRHALVKLHSLQQKISSISLSRSNTR